MIIENIFLKTAESAYQFLNYRNDYIKTFEDDYYGEYTIRKFYDLMDYNYQDDIERLEDNLFIYASKLFIPDTLNDHKEDIMYWLKHTNSVVFVNNKVTCYCFVLDVPDSAEDKSYLKYKQFMNSCV